MHYPRLSTKLRFPGKNRTMTTVTSPNDGEVLGQVERISSADVETLARRAVAGQALLQTIPTATRAKWLTDISQKIKTQSKELAMLVASEGGKPLKDAMVEVGRASTTFHLCAEECLRLHEDFIQEEAPEGGAGKKFYYRREPIGPVLALSAFNHPLNLLAHQVGSAIAAGCSIVFKPSHGTPYCGEWIMDTLTEFGVPGEVAMLCHADIPEIEALVKRSEFQFISFIGSADIGWKLQSMMAPGTRLCLEHGGTAAAVVLEDADLELAAEKLIKGAFYHAGQVCISTQKIFLHERVAKEFTDIFIKKASELRVGDARLLETDVGPLIRADVKKRIIDWVEEAKWQGAQVLFEDLDERGGNYLGPVILGQVSSQSKVWREEIFGPVVCLKTFGREEDVWKDISESPYHFQGSIFSQNLSRAMEAAKKLSAMTVVINDHTAWRIDSTPFGGHRQSGLGMGGVKYEILEQTRLKQVVTA